MTRKAMTGAEILLKALVEQGVDTIFGYPGGAVLPIYDALFQQNSIRHIVVRQEGAAVHAAEGYARTTGKPGVVLVTSGPGATNAVTGLTDALMDSVPVVCITGQVPTYMIGNDAFQECDTIGITRPCTKHNFLVKETDDVARVTHQAFFVATKGRPGPVVIDLPKDVQIDTGVYRSAEQTRHKTYRPKVKANLEDVRKAIETIAGAKRPILYAGGGVINSGPKAATLLLRFAQVTGFPVTTTLMGLGGFPASDPQFLGMPGMHGAYEANMAMHDCDVMVCIGARFDDRVTGHLDGFSPKSKKVHIDIDPSSINKNVRVEHPIIGDVAHVLEDMVRLWKADGRRKPKSDHANWWKQIDAWRARDCFAYASSDKIIKPQYALQRLQEKIKHLDPLIATDCGQHQMWAAQFLQFDKPNRWLTSGGLGTMGYGMPAAMGAQLGHPDRLCVTITGEASIMMNIQEMATLKQHHLPVKIFILNNQWMGMVRQWQELLHGERYSESYVDSLPDFVKLAKAFGANGLRAKKPSELDGLIDEMLAIDGPVIADVLVEKAENCFPMIRPGSAHDDMILSEEARSESEPMIANDGLALV